MKGLTVDKPGAPYVPTDGIEKPTPGPKQVLVKSIYVAVNPVDTFMQAYGTLVSAWPAVIGCDASGVVVEVGSGVTKFKKGDWVFGCTRLGDPGYGTYQEYYLMDEHITALKPDNVSPEGAASLGVGTYTAVLGLVDGLGLKLPGKGETPSFDQWVIVLGGAGSVGQYGVQLAKICGYKVLTTCSPGNEDLLKSLGADATLDYKLDLPTQLAAVERITSGKFASIFDTTAASMPASIEFLTKASKLDQKRLATVDDWTSIPPSPTISIYRIALGKIGKPNPDADVISTSCAAAIPYLEHYLAAGSLKTNEVLLAGEGFEVVEAAVALQNKGAKGGKKIVVKVQDA